MTRLVWSEQRARTVCRVRTPTEQVTTRKEVGKWLTDPGMHVAAQLQHCRVGQYSLIANTLDFLAAQILVFQYQP